MIQSTHHCRHRCCCFSSIYRFPMCCYPAANPFLVRVSIYIAIGIPIPHKTLTGITLTTHASNYAAIYDHMDSLPRTDTRPLFYAALPNTYCTYDTLRTDK